MNKILLASFSMAALGSGCASSQAQPQKPNILVIQTDDMGYADLSAQGVLKDIKTPNIDSIAQNGVRFTAGYSTAPQCSPARAAYGHRALSGALWRKFHP